MTGRPEAVSTHGFSEGEEVLVRDRSGHEHRTRVPDQSMLAGTRYEAPDKMLVENWSANDRGPDYLVVHPRDVRWTQAQRAIARSTRTLMLEVTIAPASPPRTADPGL